MIDNLSVDFRTSPDQYHHWVLQIEGAIARLLANFDENSPLRPDYKLKLNSYDLGVDIELHDAVQRIRFEYPQVKVVILSSLKNKVFCSGANIFMLGTSSHSWKVNFCKFTNETRNGFEDSSVHDGLHFIAAINGACAGGGYELALACDEILLVDDRNSSVSLPEVPLLGVLPGTGGLTRLTDKRRVRHDLADVFCTLTEGIRGDKAVQWKLVDAIAKPVDFPHLVDQRAQHWLEKSTKLPAIQGIQLTPLERLASANKLQYKYVIAHLNRPFFRVEIDILAPTDELEDTPDAILNAGDRWYPLQLVRELEDLILYLRTNESDLGVWVFRSKGELEKIQKMDEVLQTHAHFWLVKETKGYWRRTLSRLDVTSRSLFCFIDNEACFAGTLLEIALACDRIYMLDSPDGSCLIALSAANFGDYPMSSGDSRLQRRFNHDPIKMEGLQQTIGQRLQALKADELGLITFHPDELDWDDETRLLLEERVALSPDALTAMEANLRFTGPETMATRIFARLTAWQNWVFQRPNAVGPQGALKTYGTGSKPQFDKNRV